MLLPAQLTAQSQAPIVWGQGRWFGLVTAGTGLHSAPQGDTVLIRSSEEFPVRWHCRATFDNGLNFSPPQRLDSAEQAATTLRMAASAGKAYAFIDPAGSASRLRISDDAGRSWGFQRILSRGGIACAYACDQTVIAAYTGFVPDSSYECLVSVSLDQGSSWPVRERRINLGSLFVRRNAIACTRNRILVVAESEVSQDIHLFVATADRSGRNWTSFERLPRPAPAELKGWAVGADTSSETAVVMALWGSPQGTGLWVQRTTDGGVHWDEPQQLVVNTGIGLGYYPHVFFQGKLVGLSWRSAGTADTAFHGMNLALSANHGKDWYPRQRADTNRRNVICSFGQFYDNEVRLHWSGSPDTTWRYLDVRTVTGVLHADTVRPDVWPVTQPASVRVDAWALFEAEAQDNDTLSEVRLIVQDSTGRQWRVAMPRQRPEERVYRGEWRVPFGGQFRYRFEAEDFWENIATSPDSGWHTFITEGYISAADPVIAHRSSFIANVFPTPCNAWPTLKLSPDWFRTGPVTVTLYNLLGQRLDQQTLTQHSHWRPVPRLSTGIYLAFVENPQHRQICKFVLLR